MFFQLNTKQRTVAALTISCLVCSMIWLACTWRYGFDLADEGYYWYGAQRMLRGAVPMRDFLSYDIGRYAWGAFFMKLLGDDGIIGARVSAALFQIPTIALGIGLVLRTIDARFALRVKLALGFLMTILLNLWVHPYYKSFDYGASIMVIGMLVIMAGTQAARAWFGAGVILGVVALIGRNHGVYGAFAAVLFVLFVAIKLPNVRVLAKPVVMFILGVVVGFSPTFAMALLVDGFAQAFITTLRDLVQSGSANIGLPIPWPWTAINKDGWLYYFMMLLQGFAFLSLVLVPLAAIARLARRPLASYTRTEQLMLALACAGLGYAHYAFSRSDLTHLSHSIVPVLMIILLWGISLGRPLATAVLLLLTSALILAQEKPYLAQPLLHKKLTSLSVNGITLQVFAIDARRFNAAQHAMANVKSGASSFVALPNAPGLHAVNKVAMPIWEIYALSKRPATFEAREIARMEQAKPQLVLLSDHPLDFKDEQRYSKMHPLTYQWITQHYRRVSAPPQWAPMWQVYARNPG